MLSLAVACSSTEKTTQRDDEPQFDTTEELTDTNREELLAMLTRTRSRLSDSHLTQQHDVPAAFLKTDTTDNNTYTNPFAGYRIQILSTRDLSRADSVSTEFRLWADTTFTGYTPKAYVSFNQPHFKVHVGDFQDRQKANSASRIIKRKYADAWVVHDRIDPSNVPADTTKIRLQEPKQKQSEEN